MGELFWAFWLAGGAIAFAVVAFTTSASRGLWWRSLVLSCIAAAALVQIPLIGPDGGFVIPAVVYLATGGPWPILVILAMVAAIFWTATLATNRILGALAPRRPGGAATMFPLFAEAPAPAKSSRWIVIVAGALVAGALQAVAYFASRVDARLVRRLLSPWLEPGLTRRWVLGSWLISVALAAALGATLGFAVEVFLRRRASRGRPAPEGSTRAAAGRVEAESPPGIDR